MAEKVLQMVPMTTLTDRQQAILDFVRDYAAGAGFPPTLAEIGQAFGIRQTRGVHKHLQALETKGQLQLLPGKARGIRLPAAAVERGDMLSLPLLGRVAAGSPIGADADLEKHVLVDRALFFPRPDYLLRVKGDSMRDDGIFDGDLIAVHRTPVAENNQIVVARIDGEVTVKRFRRSKDRITLMPRNPDYAPIVVLPDADFAIEGLYCGLVRSA